MELIPDPAWKRQKFLGRQPCQSDLSQRGSPAVFRGDFRKRYELRGACAAGGEVCGLPGKKWWNWLQHCTDGLNREKRGRLHRVDLTRKPLKCEGTVRLFGVPGNFVSVNAEERLPLRTGLLTTRTVSG